MLAVGVFGGMSTALVSCGNGTQTVGGTAESAFVAVTQLADRPALNAVREGIKDELAAAGYEEGATLRWEWQSAKGSPVAATHIAKKYAGAQPDVIVAIAPRSAKAVAETSTNTPVIFSAVDNPVDTALVENVARPGGNISGVSDQSPVPQQLALIQEILPNIQTLGVVYSADAELENLMRPINSSAAELDIAIEPVKILEAREVAEATLSLVGRVDAIYVPTDKTVASALESIVQVGQANQLPVFAEDAETVEKGAIATVSFDYYDVGRQTGAMVVRVLRGSRPGDLAVEPVKALKLLVNPAAAAAMGVELPSTVTARASLAVE